MDLFIQDTKSFVLNIRFICFTYTFTYLCVQIYMCTYICLDMYSVCVHLATEDPLHTKP